MGQIIDSSSSPALSSLNQESHMGDGEGPSSVCPLLESETRLNVAPSMEVSTKESLLRKAIIEGNADDVLRQIDLGADVNVRFKYGWTPLIQAVQMDQEEIFKLLLERGADPLLKKDNGATAFINAGIVGNTTFLELLLDKGANIDEQDDYGFTALMETALYGHVKAVEFLLSRKADVNVERHARDEGKSKTTGGQIALMDAAKNGHSGILRLLINKGSNVKHQDVHLRSALHHALSGSEPNVECVNILLEFGADVNMKDRNGKTTLFLAVEKRKPNLVNALLEKSSVEADTQDCKGTSALQVAVKNGDYEIVRLLLDKGANPNDKDLILDALNKYNPLLVKLLLHYGAVVEPNEVSPNWAPVSSRWGEKLKELHEMSRPYIGKLKIFIKDEFKIQQTSTVGVYLGIYNEQEVAVKITLKSGGNERFSQEKRCLNYFQGRSHTLKLHGIEEDETRQYMCLLLCEKNVKEFFNTPLEAIDTRNILRDIVQALEDMHQENFAHQDVCPENIFIDYRGKGYLADFDKSLRFQDCSATVKRELIKGDMKGLATLVLYMVTRGQVECIPKEQEVAQVVPEKVENVAEARDLITELLTQDEVKPFFKHPFFWSPESKFKFLQEIGNDPDVKISEKCILVEKLDCQETIEGKTFQDWTSKVDAEVLANMNKQNKRFPYKNTVTSLLKFIRNMGAHLQEKPPEIRNIVNNPEEYFLGRFPDLTLHVYNTIRCLEEKKHLLDPYGFSQ